MRAETKSWRESQTKHLRAVLAVLILLGLPVLNAKKPQYDWQKGTLLEAERYPRPCKPDCGREFVDGQRLVIESGDYVLTAEHAMIRTPDVTVHGLIEFAVKKSTLWILDERGRIFEFKIVRKELK